METKIWYKSKSIILGLIVSILGILSSIGVAPSIGVWVSAHADLVLSGLGIIGVALRLINSNISILSQD